MTAARFSVFLWGSQAEMPGRPLDPMRYGAEAFKNALDTVALKGKKKKDSLAPSMPGTYNDRNNETSGAVTAT